MGKAVRVNWGLSAIRLHDDYHYTPDEVATGKFTGGPHLLFIDVNGIDENGEGSDFVPFGAVAVVDGEELGRTENNIPYGGHDFVELKEQPYMRNRSGRMKLKTGHTPQGSDAVVVVLSVSINEVDGSKALGEARELTFSFS